MLESIKTFFRKLDWVFYAALITINLILITSVWFNYADDKKEIIKLNTENRELKVIINNEVLKTNLLLQNHKSQRDVIEVQRLLIKRYQDVMEDLKRRYFDESKWIAHNVGNIASDNK